MRKNLSFYLFFAFGLAGFLLIMNSHSIGWRITQPYKSNYEWVLRSVELVSNGVEKELHEQFLSDTVISESGRERIVEMIDFVATQIKDSPSPEKIERRMSLLISSVYVIVILMSLSLYFYLRFKWKQ